MIKNLPFKKEEDTILYDAPCHLLHAQKVDKNPRNLLNSLTGVLLINIVESENKHLIVTSNVSIVNLNFKLSDLKSRSKNFLLQYINRPDDELMFAIILKNFSDRQIFIDKKLINHIIKRIDRSYGKIFDFIYKIDEISLKKKKSIDQKTIKEALAV